MNQSCVYIHLLFVGCPSHLDQMRHISTMEYYSDVKRNEIVPIAETWMDLETVIGSEVNESEKTNKLTHTCGI